MANLWMKSSRRVIRLTIKCVKYNCPRYNHKVDAAGGSITTCDGLVIRETGHWTDEKDREFKLCDRTPEEIKKLKESN